MNDAPALSERDREMLAGTHGPALALAMRILVRAARVMQAPYLIDIVGAHIDGCLYHGAASLDFVERLVDGGARVAVPTTLNVGSLDLIHPELYRGDPATGEAARQLMRAHLALGCEATFTCAPYQRAQRPAFGAHIAWAESNAIVFANSVLGARTNRYGDFIDLCAAITGRAPYAGLHVDAQRVGQTVFEAPACRGNADRRDIFFATLGLYVGARTGARVPVIVGLPADTSEDELKALGAAAASSGAVALFHAVGLTPEAPTLEAALGGAPASDVHRIEAAALEVERRRLNGAQPGEPLAAVCLGTPHFSLSEFAQLEHLLAAQSGRPKADIYVNTSRFILWELEQAGRTACLQAMGVQIVVDTCTYLTPVMRQATGLMMTNSAKWAYYAPGNIGVRVAFGSMAECIRSAYAGKVVGDA
ncbi:hypothetical protein PATSB16_07700 [Pandoraea thiooxydans]|uniref:Aconitase subunit 1 n=1 Tax=Pandoraea thiooxydans TaxID=445709 RepID=A0A0G3ER11_9BURK|nr:aconitase X catalytic domain-containing protein [Pandoraea thiooxydans]AKJ67151.1 aconitase subunit 1 [Pandoraea thiooxydans]APR94112.1 hypothetical protein PATSB16_07700 [Pandoraea thiooxydans]